MTPPLDVHRFPPAHQASAPVAGDLQHGSLLGAAKEVAINQPGANKALREIETTFGAALFVRTNRGLEANDLGLCVVRYARMIYTDLGHLRNELDAIQKGRQRPGGGRLHHGEPYRC